MLVRLPDGSRTRNITFRVDEEVYSVDFNDKGEATVSAKVAGILLERCPILKADKKQSKEIVQEEGE